MLWLALILLEHPSSSTPLDICVPPLPLDAMPTQLPTCTNLRIRSVRDAEIILHAVTLGVLPMVHRRLDDDDRLSLTTGCIYVWEERSSNPLECTGQEIQRFTEGRSWGPSRARDVSAHEASLHTCIHGYLTSLFASVVGLLVVL